MARFSSAYRKDGIMRVNRASIKELVTHAEDMLGIPRSSHEINTAYTDQNAPIPAFYSGGTFHVPRKYSRASIFHEAGDWNDGCL